MPKTAPIVALLIKLDTSLSADSPVILKNPGYEIPVLHFDHDWFDRIYDKECFMIPRVFELEFGQWDIFCNHPHLFRYKGKQYQEINIVLSTDRMYWSGTRGDARRGFFTAYKYHRRHVCTTCAGDKFRTFLEEIQYTEDSELMEYYEKREDPGYEGEEVEMDKDEGFVDVRSVDEGDDADDEYEEEEER